MRICIIGHAYVAEDNLVKWKSIASSGVEHIELHLPHHWPSWEEDYRPTRMDQNGLQIRVNHAVRTGHEDQFMFAPKIFRGLSTGNFDVLHVEQGSTAFVYSQALFERNMFSQKTKTCFFTWINWEAPLRWPWRRAEAYNLRHSDGAIGGNAEAVDLLRKHGFRGKTTVIPQLGVDTNFYSPAPNNDLKRKLNLKGTVIGFVGRLVEEKGIRLLLKATESLKTEFSLLMVGNGPLESELKNNRHGKNGALVHVPAVSHEKVRDYLHAMDILVLPSFSVPRWKEQFGHILIEAMACEVPVIGSTSAAIPEVIGDAGLLFQEKSVEDLHDKLTSLIGTPSERKRLGKAGRTRVLQKFTHESVARQTMEFWKTL